MHKAVVHLFEEVTPLRLCDFSNYDKQRRRRRHEVRLRLIGFGAGAGLGNSNSDSLTTTCGLSGRNRVV